MLLAALFVIQQTKVSLEIRGERLVVCAPKIAQALGMERLDIKPPFQEEVAAIRVTNVDRETFKKKIEQAFRGTFIQRENEWIFEQTPEQKQREKDEHFETLVADQQSFIENTKKALSKLKPLDSKLATQLLKRYDDGGITENPEPEPDRLEDFQDPEGRFAIELAIRFSPALWKDANERDARVVYSRYPTQMQKRMPVPLDDLLQKLERNQTIYAKAALALGKAPKDEDEADEWSQQYRPFSQKDFTNLIVVLTQDSFEVTAYSDKGKKTSSSYLRLSEFDPPSPNVNVKYPKAILSTLSADYEKELLGDGEVRISGRQMPFDIPFSPHLRQLFLSPEQVDPLSFVIPDTLFSANPKHNIVANLCEDFIYFNIFEDFFKAYGAFYSNVKFEGSWLTVSLPDPFVERLNTVNRARMGAIYRSFSNGPFPTLEQQIEIPELFRTNTVFHSFLYHLHRGTAGSLPERPPFLTLFGSLTSEQRQAARLRDLPLGSLTQNFLKTLYRGIFELKELRAEMNDLSDEKDDDRRQEKAQTLMSFLDGLGEEPTFLLPYGLQGNMTLRIIESHSSRLIVTRKKVAPPGPAEITEDPSSLAWTKFYSDQKIKDYKWTLENYDLNAIKVQGVRKVKLVIDTLIGYQFEVDGSQPISGSERVYSLGTLPKEILEEFEDSYHRAQKNWEEQGSKGKEDNPPPPPSAK